MYRYVRYVFDNCWWWQVAVTNRKVHVNAPINRRTSVKAGIAS